MENSRYVKLCANELVELVGKPRYITPTNYF